MRYRGKLMNKTSTSYILGLLQATSLPVEHKENDCSEAFPEPSLTPSTRPDMGAVLREALKDNLTAMNTIVD